MNFKAQYGPWAIIAGASEGTGKAFAHQIAARGLNCILIARREAPLASLITDIRKAYDVECIGASIDLTSANALDAVVDLVGDREVGLFISNAGADRNGAHFLDGDIESWIRLVNLNIITILRCCHYFGRKMRERQRGGLLLVGSGACFGGGAYLGPYSGAKAFQLCFSESLWMELQPHNVDVLHMVLTTTDTPAFRALLEEKGKKPPPGLASPQHVAEVALSHMGKGPIYNWGQRVGFRAWKRKQRVRLISVISTKMIFGTDN